MAGDSSTDCHRTCGGDGLDLRTADALSSARSVSRPYLPAVRLRPHLLHLEEVYTVRAANLRPDHARGLRAVGTGDGDGQR